MSFNISEMISVLNQQNGVMVPTNYVCSITPPTTLVGHKFIQLAPFTCMATQIPGLTLGGRDVKQSGYGIPEKRPVTASYENFSLSFIADGKGDVIEFFQRWFQNIHNTDGSTNSNQTYNGLRTYDFAYPEAYEGTIDLKLMNTIGEEIVSYKMIQAFPMRMSDVPISWLDRDQYMKIDIQIAYNYYTCSRSDPKRTTFDDSGLAISTTDHSPFEEFNL